MGLSTAKAKSLLLVLLLVVCDAPTHGNAAEVSGLYRVQLPVAEPSAAARAQALAKGLGQVVDRVSGSSAWRSQLSEQDLLSNTQRLLDQYGYTQASSGAGLLLDARFSAIALNALLAEYSIPVWGTSRPRVLFWIAVEAGSQRQVISEETLPAMVDRLERAMSYWGIPGLTPLMDLEDSSVLNVSDLWGFFSGSVESASRRYNSDALVLARVNQDSAGRWKVYWQLRIDGKTTKQSQLEENSPQLWVNGLVADVAKTLANIYAVRIDSEYRKQLFVEVKGISNFRHYVDVSRLLKSLAPVKEVLPIFVAGESIRFELTLNGNLEQLTEHLALHQSMVPTIPEELTENGPELVYLWQP